LKDRTRSLNIVARKKENERIERENHEFAKRLYSNSGSISRQKLENDYKSIVSFKKMISRVKKNKPSYNGRFMSLPPLKIKSADPIKEGEEEGEVEESKDIKSEPELN
jgi:hypothetical protein